MLDLPILQEPVQCLAWLGAAGLTPLDVDKQVHERLTPLDLRDIGLPDPKAFGQLGLRERKRGRRPVPSGLP